MPSVSVVTSPAFFVPATFHALPATSPCGGCFSPATSSEFPPNGMQKKSPRNGTMTGAGIFVAFSSCHGLT